MEVKYACHCSYRIRYHMVFVLKYRKSLIDNDIFNFFKTVFNDISQRYYLDFHAIGTDKDHLHILVESAPRYSPSRVMQICKSITAIEIFKHFPKINDFLWGGHFWSAGGHIDTVGDGYDVNAMKEYIKKQGVDDGQITLHQFTSP